MSEVAEPALALYSTAHLCCVRVKRLNKYKQPLQCRTDLFSFLSLQRKSCLAHIANNHKLLFLCNILKISLQQNSPTCNKLKTMQCTIVSQGRPHLLFIVLELFLQRYYTNKDGLMSK